jgi:hypothetical protein
LERQWQPTFVHDHDLDPDLDLDHLDLDLDHHHDPDLDPDRFTSTMPAAAANVAAFIYLKHTTLSNSCQHIFCANLHSMRY